LSVCENKCDSCGFCKDLFDSISRPLPVEIRDNRVTVD